jgi:uncharacterized protein (UPF0276 family)
MTAAPEVHTRVISPHALPLLAGIGLRAQHHQAVLDHRPHVGWFEAHSENYFAAGGAQTWFLERIREHYPLSFHGVGLSLGSVDPLSVSHLANLKRIVARFEPALVSEHLAWGSLDGRCFNDLLPMPYTEEALRHLVARVAHVQEYLGRRILIENVSSYLEFRCSAMPEWEFLAALAERSGCGILLDVNNIYVAARNHAFDPDTYLSRMPPAAVAEIHLAGHSRNQYQGREILIDTHGAPVCDAVWELYARALARFPTATVLIEWDTDIPALDVLVAEAHRADRVRSTRHDVAA